MAKKRLKSPLTRIIGGIGPKKPRAKVPGTNRRPNKSKNTA